jgi:hypothetical protein
MFIAGVVFIALGAIAIILRETVGIRARDPEDDERITQGSLNAGRAGICLGVIVLLVALFNLLRAAL